MSVPGLRSLDEASSDAGAPTAVALTASATVPLAAPSAMIADALVERVADVVVGQRPVVEVVVATVLGGGHVLVQDQPGVGKTTLARALATVIGGSLGRVQATADLLPMDLTGTSVHDPAIGWVHQPGPLQHEVVLIDELNRLAPRTQSALLEAMAEGTVTVDGTTRPLPTPFVVVATMNPHGNAGTYPLTVGQADRFAASVALGLPGRAAERRLLLEGPARREAQPVVTPGQLLAVQREIARTPVAPVVVEYVLDIVDAARALGWLSPRASRALLATARGLAAIRARSYVGPDEIQTVMPAVLGHRLANPDVDEGRSAEELTEQLTAVVRRVPVPVATESSTPRRRRLRS